MKMLKIFFYGQHSNRTPLSYPDWGSVVCKKFVIEKDPFLADFLIFGYYQDIKFHIKDIINLKQKKPSLRIILLSEEPIWDTLWSSGYDKKNRVISSEFGDLEFIFLNHTTSKIYEFEKYPYFITTNDNFFIRYSNLFKRNADLSESDYKKIWSGAQIRAAFYAEKRSGSKYGLTDDQNEVYGLSDFRTQIANDKFGDGVIRVGKGWGSGPRQHLPDWHLDKLVALDKKTYMLSALENTHHKNYITEKIFDAFAVLSVGGFKSEVQHLQTL